MKYFSKKINGYDSKKEFKRSRELELMQKNGYIKELKRQVAFELVGGFVNKSDGRIIRPIIYVADFTYQKEGRLIIEEVKGFKTAVYKIKKKLILKLISEGKIEAEFKES